MTARERNAALARGERVDRIPYLPTVLEHAARGIGRTPSDCARDPGLLAAAHLDAYARYGHDLVTVGIDVYNVEAEALGCPVRYHADDAVPGIAGHPLPAGSALPDLSFSRDRGRIGATLDAADRVRRAIGAEVPVSVALCGPFSIAVELCGYDGFVGACLDDPEWAAGLLDALLAHQAGYAEAALGLGCGVTLFESWATPPLLSPALYAAFAAPREARLIARIRAGGAAAAPLVIGGDTSALLPALLATGTTLLVADYDADPEAFLGPARDRGATLRCNLDPRLVESGPVPAILARAGALLGLAARTRRFALGTGVVSLLTPPEHLLALRRFLEEAGDPFVGPGGSGEGA